MAAKRIFIAGFGGQGILLIGQMLAYAAMLEGREVSWMPSYGPEMRGGTANCTVIISDHPIASPIVTEVDVLLAMNGSSLEKFLPMVVPGGEVIVNSGIITDKVARTDVTPGFGTPIFWMNLQIAYDLARNKPKHPVERLAVAT